MGLQSGGLMTSRMSDEDEAVISACNSLNELGVVASKHACLGESCIDSIEPVMLLQLTVTQSVSQAVARFC